MVLVLRPRSRWGGFVVDEGGVCSCGLPVVLYGCETWSLTMREERRLRVLHNRVLRKIFGYKEDKVMTESRRLHNVELYVL